MERDYIHESAHPVIVDDQERLSFDRASARLDNMAAKFLKTFKFQRFPDNNNKTGPSNEHPVHHS
jgi:hypothetical protein